MVSIVQVNVTETVGAAPATLQQAAAFVSQGGTATSQFTGSLLTQTSDLTPLLTPAKAITSASQTSGLVTITTPTAHGYTVGDSLEIVIAGVSVTGYNGTFFCTVTGDETFTYALTGSLSAGTGGTYLPYSAVELLQMVESWFAQGSNLGAYVLELGPGNVTDGVASLTTYLSQNPNSAYVAGATGYYYGYCVPRAWDASASFLALAALYENPNSQTYFFTTTTLATYSSYPPTMKSVIAVIESPVMGIYPANALTAAVYSSPHVTLTTTTAHGVVPGDWFTIIGCLPSTFNGTFLALAGTTGSTIVYGVAATPGTIATLGTLQASLYGNAGIGATEFDAAELMYQYCINSPAATSPVAPFAFRYLYNATPFPTRGMGPILTALKTAGVNIVGSGNEGGISLSIILWGTTMDGHDATFWYSQDWVQIQSNLMISNAIINGSNSPTPLYYDQNGINRLQAVEQKVMSNAVAFGLALAPVTVTAIPFVTYVNENPTDYPAGIYRGLAVSYTPQRGFTEIVFNLNVNSFPTSAS